MKPPSPPSTPERPRASANDLRPLVVHPADWKFAEDPGRALLPWAEAQQVGHRVFGRHARFVCLPARFPAGVFEHEREAMCRYLRQRVENGALVVFLVPASALAASESDAEWNRTAFVVEAVTATRLTRIDDNYPLKFTIEPTCLPGIAAHLKKNPGNFRLDVTGDGELRPATPDATQVLAGFEDPVHEPSAAAGFAGTGAWLVLPWKKDRVTDRDLPELVRRLDELEELRAAWTVRVERARALAAEVLDVARAQDEPAPVVGTRRRRGARDLEAPVKNLRDARLFAIPRGTSRGFLQRFDGAANRYWTSPLLHRGPWAVATHLLDNVQFLDGASDQIELAVIEEALEGADVRSVKRSSLSSYLTQLRHALKDVLGARMTSDLVRVRRGKSTVDIAELQAVVRRLGGAMVCPIR